MQQKKERKEELLEKGKGTSNNKKERGNKFVKERENQIIRRKEETN
jgi:hypothetical protein